MPRMLDDLEPNVSQVDMTFQTMIAYSAAKSLKRIADALEQSAKVDAQFERMRRDVTAEQG